LNLKLRRIAIVSYRIGGFGAMHVNNRDVPEHRLWTIFVLY